MAMANDQAGLTIESRPSNTAPVLREDGPHALALAHLFDQIVADAYHASIGRLISYGPRAMERELKLRAELTPWGNVTRLGVVALGDELPDDLTGVERLYWIRHSGVKSARMNAEWRCLRQTVVLTGWVRFWGIFIRLYGMLQWAYGQDRAMARMRRQFSAIGQGRGRYHLSIWSRRESYHG